MVLRWIKSLLDVPSNAILLVYAGMDQIARYLVACFISYEDWLDQLKTFRAFYGSVWIELIVAETEN